MEKIMINVIIPILNNKQITENLINSFNGDIAIILVDTGSNPEELPVVSRNTKIVKLDGDFNINKALNMGAREAFGDIWLFVHNDAMPTPEFITEIIIKISDPTLNIVSASNGRLKDCVAGHIFGMQKTLYENMGGFDENYTGYGWEEADITASALSCGAKLELIGDCPHMGAETIKSKYTPEETKTLLVKDAIYFSEKWNLPAFPITSKTEKYIDVQEIKGIVNEYWDNILNNNLLINVSKNELEVQKYLREGHPLSNLSQRYNIQCNISPELNIVSLNYSNLSPMDIPLVRECRGLFLEIDTWNIVCKSMTAFPNSGNPLVDNSIDWSTARLTEKLDGALILLYYYKDEWRTGMRMSADGSMQVSAINGAPSELTFTELTKLTIEEMGYTWEDYTSKLNPNIYYSFELTAPETRFGVIYSERKLTLISAVNKFNLKEMDIYSLKFPVEKVLYIKVNNIDEVNKTVSQYSDPLIYEGFVLVDKNYNRIKYKNPNFVEMMSEPETDDELEALEQLLQYVSSFSSLC
jgi:hypothetical protein